MTERKEYPARKQAYVTKLQTLVEQYRTCLLATADFVGSKQLQQIRKELRGNGTVIMGKKTMMRQVLRQMTQSKPELEKLVPQVRGNIGLIWTNGDPATVRDQVVANKVPAAAKVGQIAPLDVFIPAGPTTLDPGQTSFFQALNIATKISRGAIEILNEVHLIKPGDKVGNSEVTLLNKLGIKPFAYGMKVLMVFEDGQLFDAKLLDIKEEQLLSAFAACSSRVAALSLAINYPTLASLPHIVSHTFRKLVSLSMATEYTFEEAKKFREAAITASSAVPASSAAAAGASSVSSSSSSAAAPSAPAEPKKEEPPPEEDTNIGDLFG